MPLEVLDVVALRRWVITARAALSEHAGTLNALNVFPVPDRDTGTNMSVTMELAVDSLAAEAPPDLLTSVRVLARATVLSARGNSGVILSQLVRGLADVVIALDGAPLTASDVADVLREAATRARSGVRAPVEGTMLSVADAAAKAANGARDRPLSEVVDLVVAAAQDAVGRTRDQLPVLRDAGVVDAGAVGYWLVLRALQHVVRREPGGVSDGETPPWLTTAEHRCPAGGPGRVRGGDGPGYELMFVLRDSDDERVGGLATTLDALGDSVVVAGGPDLWSVHVHLDDVGAGINAAVAAGAPGRFQVTRFADQRPGRNDTDSHRAASWILALLASPGLGDLVRDADPAARVLISPDIDHVRDALSDRRDGLVLTDTPQLRALAACAAVQHPDWIVCGCAHPAQMLAALAVRAGQDDLESLWRGCDSAATAVGTHTLTGTGQDVSARCCALLDEVVADEVELVTLVAGADAPNGLLDALTEHLSRGHPQLEVTSFAGGRPGVVLDLGCE